MKRYSANVWETLIEALNVYWHVVMKEWPTLLAVFIPLQLVMAPSGTVLARTAVMFLGDLFVSFGSLFLPTAMTTFWVRTVEPCDLSEDIRHGRAHIWIVALLLLGAFRLCGHRVQLCQGGAPRTRWRLRSRERPGVRSCAGRVFGIISPKEAIHRKSIQRWPFHHNEVAVKSP